MKTFTCFILMVLSLDGMAQAQNGFSYQAVIRNNAGELVKGQNVGMQISILQGSENGAAVYTETQMPMTNNNGLLTAEIGKMDSSAFAAINWAEGPFFLKTETDITGGTNYSITGLSEILSVPLANYAAKAGNGLDYLANAKAGDLLYSNGTNWELLPKAANGKTLRLDNGKPNWAEPGYALPIITTAAPTDVMVDAATSGGHIIATGFTDISAKGVCWATSQNPTTENEKTNDANGIGTFTSKISNLQPNTTYYARAYATNGAGTAYGNQVSFKTFQSVIFPTVTTAAAINITESSAACGGNVTETGGAEILMKGVCWSTNQNPTVSDSKTEDGDGSGQFNSQLTNLKSGTTYYVRAYATNSAGTGYGEQVTLATLKTAPVVATKNIESVTAIGAVSGGTIINNGGGTISEKGICWSENENPTTYDNKIAAGTDIGTFSSAISMLKPNTSCYVRAYAVNEIGISYGDEKTFTTNDAFYDGFETGFSGTTGGWGIVTGDAVEGAYSLKTSINGASASITKTVQNSGQITFFAKISDASNGNVTFYIDDEEQGAYSNTFWGQQSFSVPAGEHTFKWQLKAFNGYTRTAWIDYIVIPK